MKKDERKAFELVKKGTKLEAKSKEDSACFVTVGYFYEAGIGTKQNFKKAFKYYMKAVKKGSSLGMYNSALCLLYRSNKKNIRKNARKGIELLVEATKMNYADAFAELSTIYREGKFVTKDLDMSDYWLTEAMKKKSWKALLIYADICLREKTQIKRLISKMLLFYSTFLCRPSEYFDDIRTCRNLKNDIKIYKNWESLEKIHPLITNCENKIVLHKYFHPGLTNSTKYSIMVVSKAISGYLRRNEKYNNELMKKLKNLWRNREKNLIAKY